jgi:hypothetical protein
MPQTIRKTYGNSPFAFSMGIRPIAFSVLTLRANCDAFFKKRKKVMESG